MGGVLRVLRYGMGQPLTYALDARDETVLTRREARVLGWFGFLGMIAAQWAYVRQLRGMR